MFRPPYHVALKDVPFPLTDAELAKQIARYNQEDGDWAKRKNIPESSYTDKT